MKNDKIEIGDEKYFFIPDDVSVKEIMTNSEKN